MRVLAAAVAARMGLTHNRVEAVRAAADKATQRRRWAAAGVAQPAFRILPADASIGALKKAAAEVGVPSVVKAGGARRSRGVVERGRLSHSQGVLGADDERGAAAAAARIRQVLGVAGRP